jgi:hypothetical protein
MYYRLQSEKKEKKDAICLMDDGKTKKVSLENNTFRIRWLQILKITAVIFIVTVLLSAWWIKHNIYASPIVPTELSPKEQMVLDTKLARLDESANIERVIPQKRNDVPHAALEPEPYSEEGAKREISLSEKELNALIANNPEVARRVAIDLSNNLVSMKLVVPIDEEIPVLGGKTLRLSLGIILGYADERPIVALKGVSLGGIPLPNAWLGNLKHKNLVDEFSTEGGFWQLFAEGVQDIHVKEGHIQIQLKE